MAIASTILILYYRHPSKTETPTHAKEDTILNIFQNRKLIIQVR
jgi:hypothetical protein